jgi:hypothetical protein
MQKQRAKVVPYRIKERQRQAAKRLNIAIRPSSDKNKKLDVYKNGFLIARIGAAGYGDYASYLQEEKKAQSLQERQTNAANSISFAMPRTPLKWELQAITPLKSSGRELF